MRQGPIFLIGIIWRVRSQRGSGNEGKKVNLTKAEKNVPKCRSAPPSSPFPSFLVFSKNGTWLAYRSAWRARYAVGRRRICEKRPSATRSARDSLNRATSDAMFKIIAVAVIGILVGIGFFDLGQEAYTLAALLLGIGALLDYSRRAAAPRH